MATTAATTLRFIAASCRALWSDCGEQGNYIAVEATEPDALECVRQFAQAAANGRSFVDLFARHFPAGCEAAAKSVPRPPAMSRRYGAHHSII
jgi:hypothetical protein